MTHLRQSVAGRRGRTPQRTKTALYGFSSVVSIQTDAQHSED